MVASNSYASVMIYKNINGDSGETISNMFADFSILAIQSLYDLPKNVTHDSISTVEVIQSVVHKLLKNLDLSKSGGPDQNRLISIVKCADSLVIALCLLYKSSS